MLVSVLMPVHGPAPFIEEAITSIENQDFLSWELLLILDRPDDDLRMRARRFSDIDPKVKIFESPGAGIVDALNFGLKKATGELIARMDSDDKMKPNRLGIQVQFLENNQDVSCVGSQMIMIDINNVVVGKTDYPRHHSEIQRHLNYQNCIGHPSVMYRKAKVIEIGSYRKALSGAEDYDLWIRLAKKSQIYNLNDFLTEYRISDGQYSKTFGKRHTLLEEILRLDVVFNFLDMIDSDAWNDEELRHVLNQVRMSNVTKHPVLLLRSFEGSIVSSLLRQASQSRGKLIKAIISAPRIILLAIFFPWTFKSLLIKKIRLRKERQK